VGKSGDKRVWAAPSESLACASYGAGLFLAHSNFNPDSAVPADAMSEEQTFRSEVNGSLPLSGHRSSGSR